MRGEGLLFFDGNRIIYLAKKHKNKICTEGYYVCVHVI